MSFFASDVDGGLLMRGRGIGRSGIAETFSKMTGMHRCACDPLFDIAIPDQVSVPAGALCKSEGGKVTSADGVGKSYCCKQQVWRLGLSRARKVLSLVRTRVSSGSSESTRSSCQALALCLYSAALVQCIDHDHDDPADFPTAA